MTSRSSTSPRLMLATSVCLLALLAVSCAHNNRNAKSSTGSSTPANGTVAGGSPNGTLADGSPVPTLANGQPAPTLANGQPAPTLANGQPAPTLANGQPAPTLANGQPAPTVAGGAPAPTVAGGAPAPTVAGGGPAFDMTIDNEAYSSPITGKVGTAIRIINNDSKAHTVTDSKNAFDIEIAAGATAALTVTAPGTYEIHCKIFPTMTGTITVT